MAEVQTRMAKCKILLRHRCTPLILVSLALSPALLHIYFSKISRHESESAEEARSNFTRTELDPQDYDVLVPPLCWQDRRKLRRWLQQQNASKEDERTFYSVVMDPLQMACRSLKRIGGWFTDRGFGYDGHKYVCLDDTAPVGADSYGCLVYSLGLGDDVSFEVQMARLGCQVHAYDGHFEARDRDPRTSSHLNLHVVRKHVVESVSAGASDDGGGGGRNETTLRKELRRNSHRDRDITYLKVDVEGQEMGLLELWLRQGLLGNVKQLGLELHHTDLNWAEYGRLFRMLAKETSLVPISYDPNVSTQDGAAKSAKYFPFFEVVLRRLDVGEEGDECGLASLLLQ